MKNKMELRILAISQNEIFARNVISAFILPLNPTIDEIGDIKTAISEAVTNCIVHAYPNSTNIDNKIIDILAETENNTLKVEIKDYGISIQNIEEATQPFYTTKTDEERSGMGFTVMESFMDELIVEKGENNGLIVKMKKSINNLENN